MPKPGWGATLLGDPADLHHWAYVLKEPFDPWVEAHGNEMVLRSSSFDELASGGDVRDRAMVLIERLNGAVAISEDARPLRFGGVVQFAPDGVLHRTVYVEAGHYEIRGSKLLATVTLSGPDGKPLPPAPPQPSEVQQWMMMIEGDELLDDALIYFGRTKASLWQPQQPEATDWFDIYKALECLERKFGGPNAFRARGWAPAGDIRLLKQTANWARHSRNNPKCPRPEPPMEFEVARTLLGRLIRHALSEIGSSR